MTISVPFGTPRFHTASQIIPESGIAEGSGIRVGEIYITKCLILGNALIGVEEHVLHEEVTLIGSPSVSDKHLYHATADTRRGSRRGIDGIGRIAAENLILDGQV